MPSVHRINLSLAVTFIYLCYSYALFSERVMDRFSTNSNFMEFASPLAFVGSWIAEETILVQEARLLSYEIDRFERTYTTEQVGAIIGLARDPVLEKVEFKASVGGSGGQSDAGVPYADVLGVNSHPYLGAVLAKAILHNCQNELKDMIGPLSFWERAILKRPGSLEFFSDVQGYESLRRRACGKLATKAFASHRHRELLPTHIREAANLPRSYTTHNRLPMATTLNQQQREIFTNYSLFMTPRERRIVDRTHRWWIDSDIDSNGHRRRHQEELHLLAPVVYGVDTYTHQLTRTGGTTASARSETIARIKDGISGDGDRQTATLLKARAGNTNVRAAAWRLLTGGGRPQLHQNKDASTNDADFDSQPRSQQFYRDVTTERSIAVSRGSLEGWCLISHDVKDNNGVVRRNSSLASSIGNHHHPRWMVVDVSAEVPDVIIPPSTIGNVQRSSYLPAYSMHPSLRHALATSGTQYDDENVDESGIGAAAELNPLLWDVGTENDEGEAFELNCGMPRSEIHRSLLGRLVGSLQSSLRLEDEERRWPSDKNTDDLLKRAEEEVFLHSRLIKHKILHTPATVRAVMGRLAPTSASYHQPMGKSCDNIISSTVWSVPTHTAELLLSTLDFQNWPRNTKSDKEYQKMPEQHRDELLTAFVQSFVYAGRLSMATRIGATATASPPPPSMACIASVLDMLSSSDGFSRNTGGGVVVNNSSGKIIADLLEKRHGGEGGGGCVGGEHTITPLLADNPILDALVNVVINTGISAQVVSIGEILRNVVGSGTITPSASSTTIPFPHLRLLTPPLNVQSLHASSLSQRKALVDLVVPPPTYRRQFTTTTDSCKGSDKRNVQTYLNLATGGTPVEGGPELLCELEQTVDHQRNRTILTDSTLFAAIWRLSQSVDDRSTKRGVTQPPITTLELASFSSASLPVTLSAESTPNTLFSTLAARASRAHSSPSSSAPFSHHHVWLAHHQLSHNRHTPMADVFSQCHNQSVVGSTSLAHADVKVACNYAFAMESLLDTTTSPSQQHQQQTSSHHFVASNYFDDLSEEKEGDTVANPSPKAVPVEGEAYHLRALRHAMKSHCGSLIIHPPSNGPPRLNTKVLPVSLPTSAAGEDVFDVEKEGTVSNALHETYFITPTARQCVNWLQEFRRASSYSTKKDLNSKSTPIITSTMSAALQALGLERPPTASLPRHIDMVYYDAHDVSTSSSSARGKSGHKVAAFDPLAVAAAQLQAILSSHPAPSLPLEKDVASSASLSSYSTYVRSVLVRLPFFMEDSADRVCESIIHATAAQPQQPNGGGRGGGGDTSMRVDLVLRESATDPRSSTTSPWSILPLWKQRQQLQSLSPAKLMHEVCHRRSLVSESFYELQPTGKWEEQLLWIRWGSGSNNNDDETTTADNDIDTSDVSIQHRTPLFNVKSDEIKQQDKHQKSRLVHGVVVMRALIKELRGRFPQLSPSGGNSAAADEGLLQEGEEENMERGGGKNTVDVTSLRAMRSQHRYLRNELAHALQGAILLQRERHSAAATTAITEAVAARDRLIADFGLVKNKEKTSSDKNNKIASDDDKYSQQASLIEESILGQEVAKIASGSITPIIVAAEILKSVSPSSLPGQISKKPLQKNKNHLVGGGDGSMMNTEDATSAAGGQTWGSVLVIVAALGTVTALLWAFGKNFKTPTRKGGRKPQPSQPVDITSSEDVHRRQR